MKKKVQEKVQERSHIPISTLELIKALPEENVWLAGKHSANTRRAYANDLKDFFESLDIKSIEELSTIDHKAAVIWKRILELRGLKPSTIRRKLSAISSLFSYLVKRRLIDLNPIREVDRPANNTRVGSTAAFSPEQTREILDFPSSETVQGLRDRAILSIGFQVGARRSEISNLRVSDFHMNLGYWSLHFVRKGGHESSVSIHPQTSHRIISYLEVSGHGEELSAPLFLAVKSNRKNDDKRRFLHPDIIDRILKKYASKIGLKRGFSAHSMRATFITRTLEKGASIEDVQLAVGHTDPSTTKLYDRRGFNPEKSASFFADY